MEITGEQLDKVGQVADSLDNLIAAATLPRLPDSHKLQYTLRDIGRLSEKLKAIVVSVSGDNPWGDS